MRVENKPTAKKKKKLATVHFHGYLGERGEKGRERERERGERFFPSPCAAVCTQRAQEVKWEVGGLGREVRVRLGRVGGWVAVGGLTGGGG